MVINKLQLGLKVVAVKAPMLMGEDIIEDIAIFSGSKLVGDDYSMHPSLRKSDPAYIIGKVNSIKITKKECVIKGFGNKTSNNK
jgi:hypothetical protein